MIVGNFKNSSDLADKKALAMRLLQIEVENQEEIGRRFASIDSPYVPPEIPVQIKSLAQVEQDEYELTNRLATALIKIGIKDIIAKQAVNGFLTNDVGTIQDVVNLIRSVPEIKKRFASLSPEDIDTDHLIRIMGYVARDYQSTNGFAFDKNGKLAVSYNDLTKMLPDNKSIMTLRTKLKKIEVEMNKGSRGNSLEMNLLKNALKKLDLTEKVIKDIGQILPSTSEIAKVKKMKTTEEGEITTEEIEERNLAVQDFKTIIESGVVYNKNEVLMANNSLQDSKITDYDAFIETLNILGAKPINGIKLREASEDLKSNFLVKDYQEIAPEEMEELYPRFTFGKAMTKREGEKERLYENEFDLDEEEEDALYFPSVKSEKYDYTYLPPYINDIMAQVKESLNEGESGDVKFYNDVKEGGLIEGIIDRIQKILYEQPLEIINLEPDTDTYLGLNLLIRFTETWIFLYKGMNEELSSENNPEIIKTIEKFLDELNKDKLLIKNIFKILDQIKIIYGNYMKFPNVGEKRIAELKKKSIANLRNESELSDLREYVDKKLSSISKIDGKTPISGKDWVYYMMNVENLINNNPKDLNITIKKAKEWAGGNNASWALTPGNNWVSNIGPNKKQIGNYAVKLANSDIRYTPNLIESTQINPKIGLGIDKKPPINKSGFNPKRIKVGKGITVDEEPKYSRFGKWVIHQKQLKDLDKLNLRYPSMQYINNVRPVSVSPDYKDVLLDILESNKLEDRKYKRLTKEEQAHFTKVMEGSGLASKFKFKGVGAINTTEDEDRFKLLLGEMKAGNNNTKMITELKSLINKFIKEGRIDQKEGYSLLSDINKI